MTISSMRATARVLRPQDRLPSAGQPGPYLAVRHHSAGLPDAPELPAGYTAEDGSKQRPIMIHRVCFGSIERFIGILTEHYAGKFPVWLAPTQVKVLPVSEKSMEYSKKVYDAIRMSGIRTELDERNEKIGYKIREAQQVERVPYMLVIGAKEVEAGTVTVRNRDTGDSITMGLDEFIAKVQEGAPRERV